jgi:hypothetical protein
MIIQGKDHASLVSKIRLKREELIHARTVKNSDGIIIVIPFFKKSLLEKQLHSLSDLHQCLSGISKVEAFPSSGILHRCCSFFVRIIFFLSTPQADTCRHCNE